jgi:hypothetical protein
MKAKLLILIFGLTFIPEVFPQVSLVLKDTRNGREWPIRKGKRLVLTNLDYINKKEDYITSGTLVSFTDSSLIVHSDWTDRDESFMFRDIDHVKVSQSSEGKSVGYMFWGMGLSCIVAAPLAGINDNGPYNFSSVLISLGTGVFFAGTGYLIFNPYDKSYRVTGTCQSRNERYLRNKNGSYLFSLATGVGASYGGMGFRFQARLGGATGVGFHIGTGWDFPYLTDSITKIVVPCCFSVLAGVKFFPYHGWYLDVQFGNFGRVATVTIEENKMIIHKVTTPYGFVFTLGGDWFFGRTFGLNLGFGTALDLTAPESSNTFPAFDMGFIIKF